MRAREPISEGLISLCTLSMVHFCGWKFHHKLIMAKADARVPRALRFRHELINIEILAAVGCIGNEKVSTDGFQ
ncbi:hypothetical protein VL15_37000 [Burkholderia cepacia]|uniref:Uncharacterized protein n=1 Tax=Burkholderia cepacia TaxID=292 RepID=A0A0J5W562_BURCE|nr:hypothetical protein VL15_37000 [Burkholderia cepacia]